MSRVAPSPPEQGQLVNVRQRHCVVTGVAKSTLPASPLHPSNNPWLQAEFGWGQQTAYTFIAIAERLKALTKSNVAYLYQAIQLNDQEQFCPA